MKLTHFAAFAPRCPVCLGGGRAPPPLVLAMVCERTDTEVTAGTLHCPACQHEFPVISGIPVIVPDLANLLAQRGIELMLRQDLDPRLESLVGDAIGPDSWFDGLRQTQSTYGWDHYGDLDPEEIAVSEGVRPGAVRRCAERLLALAGPAGADVTKVVDLGCAAGRSSFALAHAHPRALVLGADMHLGMLGLAQAALSGEVSYPRRRIGLVYDRRRFAVALDGADRVDFWACDAACLPLQPATADLTMALNLLDCVPDPRRLLESLARVTAPGGRILLATPYDWSTRATPIGAWLGGHSQRADHAGAGETFLRELVGGPPDHAIAGLAILQEQAGFAWHTRLHARSAVHYATHLMALGRL